MSDHWSGRSTEGKAPAAAGETAMETARVDPSLARLCRETQTDPAAVSQRFVGCRWWMTLTTEGPAVIGVNDLGGEMVLRGRVGLHGVVALVREDGGSALVLDLRLMTDAPADGAAPALS